MIPKRVGAVGNGRIKEWEVARGRGGGGVTKGLTKRRAWEIVPLRISWVS